ncbi:MAG: 50S ribosomal protein L10 [Thiomargarita sp.]|nr:50S ribosomal protein L10 [Thiomargarita sp.]
MPLKLSDKRAIIATVNDLASRAHSAVVAEYRGLTSAEMTELRHKARDAGVHLQVVRNTLAQRAVLKTNFECLQPTLVGPVIMAFSLNEPKAAAQVLNDFLKTNKKLVIKSLGLGGQLLPASDLERIANLPSHEEAISMLMSVMQGPMTKLVRTLAEPHAKLVRTIAAVRDKQSS